MPPGLTVSASFVPTGLRVMAISGAVIEGGMRSRMTVPPTLPSPLSLLLPVTVTMSTPFLLLSSTTNVQVHVVPATEHAAS